MAMYLKNSNNSSSICVSGDDIKNMYKLYTQYTLPNFKVTTGLNQLIDNMMIPNNCQFVIWINSDTQVGLEVQKAISKYAFGHLIVSRHDNTCYLTFRSYNTADIYFNTYSKTNNVGWLDYWYKVNLSEQHVTN